ncbi:MAG: hypothetical protein JW953_05115 [Anaerolineae bacterium]|nr:hypothetical protein [Anaerolineae bacterium]
MSNHKQKIAFALIIGAALVCTGLMFSLGPIMAYRFGPPDLTATAGAVSAQATGVSLKLPRRPCGGAMSLEACRYPKISPGMACELRWCL